MDELGHVLDERAGAIAQHGLLGGVGGGVVLVAYEGCTILGFIRWRLVFGHGFVDVRNLA